MSGLAKPERSQRLAGGQALSPLFSIGSYLLPSITANNHVGSPRFSGLQRVLKWLLVSIRESLECPDRWPAVRTFIVPGNHDCDFVNESDLRRLTVEAIVSGSRKLRGEGELAKKLLSVQDQFFQFQQAVDQVGGIRGSWVTCTETLNIGGRRIRINCYNTALMSSMHETPGKLQFPVPSETVQETRRLDWDLVVTIFHHPYNWLEPTNARQFSKHICETSDLVLTGHEHEERSYRTKMSTGEAVQYVEGGVLQSNDPHSSDFNVIVCDLAEAKHKVVNCGWSGVQYTVDPQSEWKPFVRNQAIRETLSNNGEFLSFLLDAGTGFTHPNKALLKLVLCNIN